MVKSRRSRRRTRISSSRQRFPNPRSFHREPLRASATWRGGPTSWRSQVTAAVSPRGTARPAVFTLSSRSGMLPPAIILRLSKGMGAALRAAFSPDGSAFISAGGSETGNTLFFWNLKTGKLLAREPLKGEVYQLAFLPGRNRFVTATSEVVLWDVSPNRTTATKVPAPIAVVFHFAVSPDGKRLLTIGHRDVQLWDVATMKRVTALYDDKVHAENNRFVFSPDGKAILGYDWETGMIRRWDAATGKPMAGEPVKLPSYRQHAQFSPNGRYIGFHQEEHVAIHDVATGKQVCQITGVKNQNFRFSPDSTTVAVGGESLRLHKVADGKLSRHLSGSRQPHHWPPLRRCKNATFTDRGP